MVSRSIKEGYLNLGILALIALLSVSFLIHSVIAAVNTTPTTQVIVGNATPTVDSVVLNGGQDITLTANATTSVKISFSVTDLNGCQDVFVKGNTTSTAFRSGVGPTCTEDNLNCYRVSTSTNDCTGTSTTANATATVDIYYFAQATDASSSFPTEDWKAFVKVEDSEGATGSNTSAGVELNTLVAINVQSSTIDYGTIPAGGSDTTLDVKVPFDNAGNSSTSLQLSGTAMTKGTDIIPTSSQRYATTSVSFSSGIQLTGTPTDVPGTTIPSPTSTNLVSQDIFWGLEVPGATPTGTYTGTNTYTAKYQP